MWTEWATEHFFVCGVGFYRCCMFDIMIIGCDKMVLTFHYSMVFNLLT